MEEQIKEAIEKYMEQIIPGYIEQIIRKIDERNNLQTYSVKKASELTGIGYTKLNNAAKQGIIPSIHDGVTYKIKHTDLFYYIENEKAKNKL